MFKSSKTKKKWCRATKKGHRKSKWVLAQRRSSYERECHKTDCKKIVLADKNTIDRKKDFYMVSKVMAVSDTESASQYRRWNSAMVNPTIKLKTPKRAEFGSKPVHAKIT